MEIGVRLIEEKARSFPQERRSEWRRVLGHTHTYSGSGDHGGPIKPPENYRRMAEWAARVGVDALGMGSPYTPELAAQYGYYENKARELYYSGDFDQRSVCGLDELEESHGWE